MKTNRLFVSCALALLIQGSAVLASEQHAGHGDFCDPATTTAEAVLGVADFNADGRVGEDDRQRLQQAIDSGDYAAFYDLDADGELSTADLDHPAASAGGESKPVDRELARLFAATEKYRDRDVAIEDDRFMPYTPAAHGHGAHWARHPETATLDYRFEHDRPEGLNYDADGKLWGVFYMVGPSPFKRDGTRFPPGHELRLGKPAPDGFAGNQDVWHSHAGVCFEGVDFRDPTLDPEKLGFTEATNPRACLGEIEGPAMTRSGDAQWWPKFHMLHVWLYELNPCGTFAGAHPLLARDAPHPHEAIAENAQRPNAPHPDYPFEGGTMCAWLAEIDVAPASCQRDGTAR